MLEIPIFPLQTVLYPDGPLPLRIFEPRYLSMVSRCLQRDEGFGVLLIREGSEIGDAETYDIGTIAEIVDWYQAEGGLLGVTAKGTDRFRLESFERQDDGLYVGRVEVLGRETPAPLPEEYRSLQTVLSDILDELGDHYSAFPKAFDDATWVSYRLAELLPLPLPTKQIMLEMVDAPQRLGLLRPHVENVAVSPN